jgi:DNA repair protein RecN (Recombination protein N)
MDRVQIFICTNVGEGLKSLSKIASGGEISRVMPALKTVLSAYDEIPPMIFDEIDTGISGQAGKAVAEKMKLISDTHQVICVTHLPVIAASGKTNYFIEKNTKEGRTFTEVLKLKEEQIVSEIARILAGNDLSDAVLKHAKELRKNMKCKA